VSVLTARILERPEGLLGTSKSCERLQNIVSGELALVAKLQQSLLVALVNRAVGLIDGLASGVEAGADGGTELVEQRCLRVITRGIGRWGRPRWGRRWACVERGVKGIHRTRERASCARGRPQGLFADGFLLVKGEVAAEQAEGALDIRFVEGGVGRGGSLRG